MSRGGLAIWHSRRFPGGPLSFGVGTDALATQADVLWMRMHATLMKKTHMHNPPINRFNLAPPPHGQKWWRADVGLKYQGQFHSQVQPWLCQILWFLLMSEVTVFRIGDAILFPLVMLFYLQRKYVLSFVGVASAHGWRGSLEICVCKHLYS